MECRLVRKMGRDEEPVLRATHLFIPTAGRAEFIVTGPPANVTEARLITRKVDTGPGGDPDPKRPLFNIDVSENTTSKTRLPKVPATSGPPPAPRFADLTKAAPTKHASSTSPRTTPTSTSPSPAQTPKPYNMDDPPAIVTTQGSVEDWIVENRSEENHEFHMHQIHFALMARDGKPVPTEDQQILDTVNIPFWEGTGPYPSVTVRMDFRGPDIGDFVYHCHILDHEDGGMMAIIRVLPRTQGAATTTSK